MNFEKEFARVIVERARALAGSPIAGWYRSQFDKKVERLMPSDEKVVFSGKFCAVRVSAPDTLYVFNDEASVTAFLDSPEPSRAWELSATVGREVHLIKSQPVLRFGNPDYGTPDRQPQPPSEVQD